MLFFVTREREFIFKGKRLGKTGRPRGFFAGEVLHRWLVQNTPPEGLPRDETDAAKVLLSLAALLPDPRQRRRLRANEAAAAIEGLGAIRSLDQAWGTLLPYYHKCQIVPAVRRVRGGKRKLGWLVWAPDDICAAVAEVMLLRCLGAWFSLCSECFRAFPGRPPKIKGQSIWKGEREKRFFLCRKCRRKQGGQGQQGQFLTWLRGLVRAKKITPEERDQIKARLKNETPQALRQEITEKLVAEGRLRRYRPRLH